MSARTCLDCAFWTWEDGMRGYSPDTPGYDAEMYCGKKHWELKMYSDGRGDVRNKLKRAATCADFTPEEGT